MNTNIFNDYYNYKAKVLYKYSLLLYRIIGVEKNKLWHSRKKFESVLDWTLNDYLTNIDNKRTDERLIRVFITDKNVSKYNINRELLSAINYFIDQKRGFEIKAYEKEIILLASILKIANHLDISTSPYQNNKNNYKTILNNQIEKFNKIPFLINIDNGKKQTNNLLELIKENVKKERKIYDTLNSKVSFNRYINISEEDKYYLAQYNYSVQGLKNIDAKANNYIYTKEDIDDKFALISRDIVFLTLMKLLSVRKLRKIFFIPIKSDFFLNENNVKELATINNNSKSKKYIRVLINYDEYNENIQILANKYQIDYYLYCSKSTTLSEEKPEYNKYLLSNDFVENNKESYEKFVNENKEIIIENFKGIVMDNDLVSERKAN